MKLKLPSALPRAISKIIYTNRKYKFPADSISATKASAYARGLAQAKFSLY